ncbi:MAG: hypothetical protein OEV74_11065 [Cyclobacteriaceae bacterium]|nr:hypothetical protein [Cyclobacteriaceae bacterium]MDH4296812.1 hypothetical protein [Cyclobacteriaceae bacterium]MDH5247442.1 hypothetical protein [Cyclobacteriaceae bacterium]
MDITNIVMVACVAMAWLMFTKTFFRPKIIMNYSLSFFMIFAFTSTQFYLPLLFTTLEGKPLIYNLEMPDQVFLHSFASLIVLTLAHGVYRFLLKIPVKNRFPLLTKIGFFIPPTHFQLFLMGAVGILAQYYVFFMSPDVGWEVTGSASDKLIQGLIPFSYAPFFIPFGKLYGNNERVSKIFIPLLLIFTVALFAVSVGRNSRGAFMLGFASIGFAYGLGLLLGVFKTRIFTWRNAFIVGISVWLLIGPIADLGTAMVIVRGDREDVSAEELLALTLETFGDKDAIRKRRQEDKSESFEIDWDERYLDNIFTARFANIKFNDMSLVQQAKLGTHEPNMFDRSVDYILGSLPEPFLDIFNVDVDKETVYGMSLGDYLYRIAGGQGYIEGFRTGHFAGTGMTAFGWWYLLLLGIGIIPVFYLFDVFLMKTRDPNSPDQSGNQKIQFSFCVIMGLTSIFHFLGFESVVSLATFLIRGWIQMVLLYFAVFQFSRLISGWRKVAVRLRF